VIPELKDKPGWLETPSLASPPVFFSKLGEGIKGWFGWTKQDDDYL